MSSASRHDPHHAEPTAPGLAHAGKLWFGVLFPVAAVSAALRFWGLTQKSFWLDEGASAVLVGRSWADMIPRILEWEKHPPLYFMLLKFWAGVFGHGDAALRAFSAVAGLGTVFLCYGIARRISGHTAGAVAALLAGTSAYQVFFAQEARHYVLVGLFFAASTYFLVRICTGFRPRWSDWAGYVLTNAAAVYTFYYAIFGVAAQAMAFWAGLFFRARVEQAGGRASLLRRALRGWLWANVVLVAIVLPLIPAGLHQLSFAQKAEMGPGEVGVGGWTVPSALREFLSGFFLPYGAGAAADFSEVAYMVLAFLPMLLGIVCALGRPGRWIVLYVLFLFPFLFLWLFPFKVFGFQSKHVFYISFLPFVMVGACVAEVRTRLPGIVLAGAILLTNVLSLAIYYQPDFQKEDWRAVSSYIKSGYQPGDALYLNPVYVVYPFGRYWDFSLAKLAYSTAAERQEDFWGELVESSSRLWLIEASNPLIGPDPAATRWFQERMHLVTTNDWSFFYSKVRVILLARKATGGGESEIH